MTINITEIGPHFVAEAEGIDLRRLSDEDFAILKNAWQDHGVIRIRDQSYVDEESFLAFASRFGPLDDAPDTSLRPDLPKLAVISNIVEGGRTIGSLGSGEAKWHSDMTYIDQPPRASVLLGREIPPAGGDTWFMDMEQVLAGLPKQLRRQIDNLELKHDATRNSTGEVRNRYRGVEIGEDRPGAVHPAVIAQPDNGRSALYLGRRLGAYAIGFTDAESKALLDALWAQVEASRAVWVQTWRAGDVLVWDNRRVLHRRDSFDSNARRLMHRAQISGSSRPVSAGSTVAV